MQPSDRANINSQPEHLQAQNAGTGHADPFRVEWAAEISREVHAVYIVRHDMAAYMALAENESIGRVRYNFQQKLLTDGLLMGWNDRESTVSGPHHENTPDTSDTDTSGTVPENSDTDTSRTVTDPVPEPVPSSPSWTDEEVQVDQEESNDTCKAHISGVNSAEAVRVDEEESSEFGSSQEGYIGDNSENAASMSESPPRRVRSPGYI